MAGIAPRRRRPVSRGALDALRPVFRYSHRRDAYVLRGVGGWIGPVLVPRSPEAASPASPEDQGRLTGFPWNVLKLDLAPGHEQPKPNRLVLASCLALGGSLLADALLVVIGTAIFPATKGYVHFHFADYGKLTAIGVVGACAAWPIATRLTSTPRGLFLRLAVVVTLVLFLPDLYILQQGQRPDAVAVLMGMHLAIALVTYNALVHLAPAGRPRQSAVVHEVAR
jgi:hypothetical protein